MTRRLRPLARRDVRDAALWYDTQRPGLGDEFLAAVEAALQSIERSPGLYPLVYGDLRRAPVSRFPYRIFFTCGESSIDVFAIVHYRRHPAAWKGRG